jgi:hypothetical protein
MDMQTMPFGDAHGLVLDGTRIGIDVDRRMAVYGFAAHAAGV